MRMRVRVIPRSSKNEISQAGDTFKVRLTAPPADGAANEALLKLLAERLGVPRRSASNLLKASLDGKKLFRSTIIPG